MKRLFVWKRVCPSAVLTAASALFAMPECFAEEAPAAGAERIIWAVKCSGAMPKPMIIGFIVLAALVILTVRAVKTKEKKDK